MRSAKGVIFTLCTLSKARQATALANSTHTVSAPRKDFMRITLMTHIPYQLVIWRIKQVMNSHG